MRVVHLPTVSQRELRRRLEGLDGLPLRPATARFLLDRTGDDSDGAAERPAKLAWRTEAETDPGWVLLHARSATGGPPDPLCALADRPWWPACSRLVNEALERLWKHDLAAALATARLAQEAHDSDPGALAQAALLHNLGLWAIASVQPGWLPAWLRTSPGPERRDFERESLGIAVDTLGRKFAQRWELGRLICDATWLHADPGPGTPRGTPQANRLRIIQAACALAEQTPWSLVGAEPARPASHDPRVKILMAEVQARCRGPFVDPGSTGREERLTRENARLRLTVASLAASQATRDRLLEALARSDPNDSPETWAERAGLVWCGEPGVSTAQVEWAPEDDRKEPTSTTQRPPSLVEPFRSGRRTLAALRLWTEAPGDPIPQASGRVLAAWQAWARLVDDRAQLEAQLEGTLASLRELTRGDDQRQRKARLDALAEFAAGAGHELNNPLAVIVGRAQLLLAREDDPSAVRSLRAILTQAQRAHRILRDLMYVARPPEPRPRFCLPDDLWRASLRDARPDADERGVVVSYEGSDQGKSIWADPDALRHLADVLLRNAIEATPPGGTVRVSTSGVGTSLHWTIHDSGRGVAAAEGPHLFDPFYCGRQAGRGLGMGLPRVARFLDLVGGEIQWQTAPGHGTSFVVQIPLVEPPKPPALDPPAVPARGHDHLASA